MVITFGGRISLISPLIIGRMSQKIGFIGLGVMGRPMAGHLLAKGHRLTVFNRSRPAVDELEPIS